MEASDRSRIFERAGEVGRLISQTPEYAYLKASMKEIEADDEARKSLDRMRELQAQLIECLEREEEPPEELRSELGTLSEDMQASARYQALISAQANFDKLMDKVNQSIARGLKEGEASRIILPS
jgi:cell fate (sporulation/competence/biofilm development) regulator YlbF (YheA/YmcA/DUF963 family)